MLLPPHGNGPYRVMRAFGGAAVRALDASLVDPAASQGARMRVIAEGMTGTAFARDHAWTGSEPLSALRGLPVRTHGELVPWLDRVEAGEGNVLTRAPVRSLLETSGTTGRPKHLPVTDAWAESVAMAQRLWVLALLRDDEGLASGKALSIVSAAVHGRSTGGLAIGSNTGRMFLAQPWWVRWRAPVPYSAYCIEDSEVRAYAILRHALTQPVTSWTTANPSTLLLYCRRMRIWWEELRRDCADGTLGRLGQRGLKRASLAAEPELPWDLRRINCWTGGAASFFVSRLPDALGRSVPVRDAGITASEGYFAIPLDDGDPVAWLAGHVLEFVGDDGEARWAWEVEVGREYRLIITTEAGMYRYDIGDIVRITGWAGAAPRMVFVRKAGNVLNAIGEKVTEEQIADAARRAFPRASAVSVCVPLAEIPAFQVATTSATPDAAAAFDAALRSTNVEYDGKRGSDRLAMPVVHIIPADVFERWRALRVAGGAPDAQVKDPWVLSPERWEELIRC